MKGITVINKTTGIEQVLWYLSRLHKIYNSRFKINNNIIAIRKNECDLIVIKIGDTEHSIKEAFIFFEEYLAKKDIIWNIWK